MAVEDAWEYPDGRRRERYGVGLRWRARWRENGRSRSRSFRTKKAAETFLIHQLANPQRAAREVLVRDLVESWKRGKAHRAKATRRAAALAGAHVTARWGDHLASEVAPSQVQAWLAGLVTERGPASNSLRRQVLQCLNGALQLAVDDGVLERNPCARIASPMPAHRDVEYMSAAELQALADAAGKYRPLVLLLGTTGLRIGEACGLDVSDVRGRRLRVRPEVSKSARGRDVPVAPAVLALLDRGRSGPLFTGARGGRLNADWWRKSVLAPAAAAVGRPGLTPHVLRHTAASLAIASGADVLMVQAMLGHKSAAVTLGVYGHLWRSGLDDVAERMDRLLCDEGATDAG